MALILRKDHVERELYIYDDVTGERLAGPYDNNQEALDALAEMVAARLRFDDASKKDIKRRRN